MQTNFRLLVFLTALATLMFELVASRLADFHLGAGNAYLAIPITFLGLALGSLHVHARPRIVERFRPITALSVLAALCFVSLMAIFVLFSRVLPVVSALEVTTNRAYLLYKTLAFIGVLLLPFYYFGRILTVSYQIKRKEIGAIYSADFWGAALACAVTPVLFHFGGLPNVSLVLLALTFVPVLVFFNGGLAARIGIGVALVVVCVAGARIITAMDDSLDYGRYSVKYDQREIAHEWNEYSRVAVLSWNQKTGAGGGHKIVHDNSRSNVHVRTYDPRWVGSTPQQLEAVYVPAILGRDIEKVLVMFAGCGREMIAINETLGGRAHITGVELNPLVRDLAVNTEALRRHRLQEFYDLPNIDLVIDEGRHFLSTTDDVYDAIFVGSNAATGVHLTGHSRKYLDTAEAFHLYLDRLSEDGVLIFDHQPVERRIKTMKRVLKERGLQRLAYNVVLLDSLWANDDMIVSPSGFSGDEVRRLVEAAGSKPERVRYAPGRKNNDAFYRGPVNSRIQPGDAMTDDRPFLLGLYWKDYQLFLPKDKRMGHAHYLSWIKITTLIVLVAISCVFIALSVIGSSGHLPPSILLYLLVTGFCFMLVEIALMAKLELFLQKPIVSMAVVLSTFLLTSGIGSWLFPRIRHRIRIGAVCLGIAALLAASVFVLQGINTALLGIPLAAKLLVAFVVMAPIGVTLGLFYPYAVSCLVSNDRPGAVAITYGISTLSSVIGATYAMTMMLDLGFNSLLWQACVGYLLLSLFLLVYTRVLKGRFLTL